MDSGPGFARVGAGSDFDLVLFVPLIILIAKPNTPQSNDQRSSRATSPSDLIDQPDVGIDGGDEADPGTREEIDFSPQASMNGSIELKPEIAEVQHVAPIDRARRRTGSQAVAEVETRGAQLGCERPAAIREREPMCPVADAANRNVEPTLYPRAARNCLPLAHEGSREGRVPALGKCCVTQMNRMSLEEIELDVREGERLDALESNFRCRGSSCGRGALGSTCRGLRYPSRLARNKEALILARNTVGAGASSSAVRAREVSATRSNTTVNARAPGLTTLDTRDARDPDHPGTACDCLGRVLLQC